MTERQVISSMLLAVLVITAAAGSVMATPGSEASPPVTVEHAFVGTSADSDHAIVVTLTIAPTEATGAINNTVLTIRASDAAFIDPASISTTETAGGDQVIMQWDTKPATFDIGRLEPGETASISFRVYPKAVLPDGRTLATIDIKTQFMDTKRVITEETAIAPSVNASEASYAMPPSLPPLVSGGLGAFVATVVFGAVAVVYRRRRRAILCGLLRSAHDQATSLGAKEAIEDALSRLGGDPSSDRSTMQPENVDESSTDTPTFDFNE
jgi:hypothetical protein